MKQRFGQTRPVMRLGVAIVHSGRHLGGMVKPSPLDDPRVSVHAWARYKRLMWLMFGITTVMVIVALTAIYLRVGMVSPHFFIATGLGIAFAMLLMSALMGLVFLSSGTGHDEAVEDLSETEDQASGTRRR